ncbi:MAG: thiolase family protein [Aigarchaeota archaeon]|nr:thiolase family protein [Candidatus Pelearchaeum maunauluense]
MSGFRGIAAISGYAETPFSRARVDKGEPRLTAEEYYAWALELLLKQTGLEKKDLTGQGVGIIGSEWPHSEIWSAEAIQNLGLEPKLLVRADHGGANAAALLVQGVLAIQAGYVEHFLMLGADTPLSITGPASRTWRYDENYLKPFGTMGPNSLIAMAMRRYMNDYGAKPEHFGTVSVVQRKHATLNPNAYLKTPLTMEDYLNSRLISDPLRLLDICIWVNGGFAILLSSASAAKRITDKPVSILGFGEWHNPNAGQPMHDITTTGVKIAAEQAYKMSGITPRDVSLFQPYDDYTVAVLMQIEDAGFCKKGEAGRFLEENDISYQGQLPVNTGGGQLSAGQAGMAGGFLHFVEAARQLRGEAGQRQVKDARIGLVTSLGCVGFEGHFINNYAVVLGGEV